MKRAVAFLLLYSLIFHISTLKTLAEQISKPELNSEAAILMDADTGIIIYQKNIDQKLYPASITKVMTALVTLDAVGDQLESRILFSPEAVDLPYGSSSIAMYAGDSLTIEQALHGLLICSANEVANAIAENIGETYDDFIDKMNKKAVLLGTKNTHFVNPSGLYDDEHYTSAYDMALVMREAVKNPYFVKFFSETSYEIPPTEEQPEIRSLNTKNKLLLPGGNYYRDYIIGSKTGFVNESKHTLATYAQMDDHRLITIVLRAEKNKDYEDTIALMDYGFGSYRYANILDASSVVKTATVIVDPENPALNRTIALHAKDNVEGEYPACIDERTVNLEYKIPGSITPPIQTDDLIGTLLVKYKDVTLKEIGLYASESVEKPQPAIIASNTRAPVQPDSDNPRYAGGFSFGFLGDIFSSIIASVSPIQLNPVFTMILLISISMILMVYLMGIIIHSKNRNKEKELLKYINRSRKK